MFTVAVDLFATDTTDYADMVLPAASFLECDDLVASYFHLSLSAQVKAIEPLGESLPNTEIFRRLAAAMGFDEPELQESDADVIARVLEPTGVEFAELAARGTVWLEPEPVIQFADLRFPPRAAAPRSRPSARRPMATPASQSRTRTRDPLRTGFACCPQRLHGCSTTASRTTPS